MCATRPGPFTIGCRTANVPLDETNLVWAAAARLWTALGRAGEPRDTRVAIEKAIPVAAGLGGGSADAAAALLGLGKLWGGVPMTLLREVSASVGADVPFFLSGGTALGLGRGEEIYPLVDLPPHWVVIVRPPYGVSTAEAYAWYDEDRAAGHREPRELQVLPVPWPTRAAQMINDLEPPVVEAASPDRRVEDRTPRGGRSRRRDVRQRLGRIRPVPQPRRRTPVDPAALERRRPRAADQDPQPCGARTSRPPYRPTVAVNRREFTTRVHHEGSRRGFTERKVIGLREGRKFFYRMHDASDDDHSDVPGRTDVGQWIPIHDSQIGELACLNRSEIAIDRSARATFTVAV